MMEQNDGLTVWRYGMEGWICPRCGKVHAPYVQECNCRPPVRDNTEWPYALPGTTAWIWRLS